MTARRAGGMTGFLRLSWPVKTGHPGDVAPAHPAKNANLFCETEQHELDGLFLQAMTGAVLSALTIGTSVFGHPSPLCTLLLTPSWPGSVQANHCRDYDGEARRQT
jgi:hypothetical protein